MPYTKIQIISMAFLEIGKRPINDIKEAGDLGAAANLIYDVKLKSCLASYDWRFATTQRQLSKLASSPIKKWKNAYSLPADYSACVSVYPESDFDIFERYIYSNEDELFIEYRFVPDNSLLPDYFIEYFKIELAKSLSRFSVVNAGLLESIDKSVEKEFFRATQSDAKSKPTRQILFDDSYISVRA